MKNNLQIIENPYELESMPDPFTDDIKMRCPHCKKLNCSFLKNVWIHFYHRKSKFIDLNAHSKCGLCSEGIKASNCPARKLWLYHTTGKLTFSRIFP